MKLIKSKVYLFMCAVFLCFLSIFSSPVYAESTVMVASDDVHQLPAQNNISVNKSWTITFNGAITWNKIDGISVQKNSDFVPIEVNKITSTTISITPTIFYEANTKYTLKIFLTNGSKYSLDFTTEPVLTTQNSNPRVLAVKATDDGTIYVKFDKAIDKKTAFITSNWELNGYALGNIGFKEGDFYISNDGTIIQLKNLLKYIDLGSNTLYIHPNIKDTYGNAIKASTIASFEYRTNSTINY